MKFAIDVVDRDITELVTKFIAITGAEPWSKKFAVLRRQLRDNPFLRDWQAEHFGVELKLLQLIEEQERTGAFSVHVEDQLHYKLYAFVAGVVRIHERLCLAGQRRLRGMLRDGLQPDNNLLSLQHEILTVVHLVGRGYDVVMNDLENGSGVDFIASLQGLELEIECKMFTGDIGRQIHRRKALDLHKHLSVTLQRAYGTAAKSRLVRITIPTRLTCSPLQLQGIDSTVSVALQPNAFAAKTEYCEVQVSEFDVADSPFNVSAPSEVTLEAISTFVEAKLNRINKELMIIFSPGKRALVALVESARPDAVLKGIYRQLREAAKGQFTRSRPGILSVQFQDLTADQMEGIAMSDTTERTKATGLQLMTSSFLASENRRHIHSVSYRSHGRLLAQDRALANTIQETGLGYFIRNPFSPYHQDPRASIFGGLD